MIAQDIQTDSVHFVPAHMHSFPNPPEVLTRVPPTLLSHASMRSIKSDLIQSEEVEEAPSVDGVRRMGAGLTWA